MAQPLKENTPPFCLALYGTDNKFNSDTIMKRLKYIQQELLSVGIQILGISSDGDPKLLKSMVILTELGSKVNESDFNDCAW